MTATIITTFPRLYSILENKDAGKYELAKRPAATVPPTLLEKRIKDLTLGEVEAIALILSTWEAAKAKHAREMQIYDQRVQFVRGHIINDMIKCLMDARVEVENGAFFMMPQHTAEYLVNHVLVGLEFDDAAGILDSLTAVIAQLEDVAKIYLMGVKDSVHPMPTRLSMPSPDAPPDVLPTDDDLPF